MDLGENYDNQQALLSQVNANQEKIILKHRFEKMLKDPFFAGAVKITHDIQQDITGRNLVVIEDILDSGNTLCFLKQYFATKGAASVSICTLLDKPSRRTKVITADYIGFTVPDEFVVGYGLDYCQKYRNLPYIGVLKPEVYGGNDE